jgi:hypothetical protein
MQPDLIVAHLAQAENHVRLGAAHLVRQRKIVAGLRQTKLGPQYADRAVTLLAVFEELQKMHIAHRDWLLDEFNRAGGVDWVSTANIGTPEK